MSRFRLRTLFLIVLFSAFGSLALNRYLLTRPPVQGTYSSAALTELLSDGKTVLITIDADWAINPTNRPRYMSSDVSRRIRELNIETLTANWTSPDPAVDSLMETLHKDAVPTLALFTPDSPNRPVVLPHDPSDSDILNALNSNGMADRIKP